MGIEALSKMAAAPMRAVRPIMLRGLYANPEKEVIRLRDRGVLTQIARGTYLVKPDTVPPDQEWRPGFEAVAMAYATAAYGDRVPVLVGVGAARFHHAIPRALAVTVVAVPAPHREVHLDTGGRIVFTTTDTEQIDARAERTPLGAMLVATPEQTLIDLVARPNLGGVPEEAAVAARNLAMRTDAARVERILNRYPATVQKKVHRLAGQAGTPGAPSG